MSSKKNEDIDKLSWKQVNDENSNAFEEGTFEETYEEDEDIFDHQISIVSQETTKAELNKLLSKNYKNISSQKNSVNFDTKLTNYVNMIHNTKEEKSSKHSFFIKEDNLLPVFDNKFYVYEDPHGKAFKSTSKTWNDNNAIFSDFQDFLNEKKNIENRKSVPYLTKQNQLYSIFRPFEAVHENGLFSEKNTDSFALIENVESSHSLFLIRILNNSPAYQGDFVHLKGLFRLKNIDDKNRYINDYDIFDFSKYHEMIDKMKTNDIIFVYPHDYILNVSYDGDTSPKKFKIVEKNMMYIKIHSENNEDSVLYYNLEKIQQNRFMIYPYRIKNPVTKHSSFKKNTLFLFDPKSNIKDQIEFTKLSPTTYLFNQFKNLKKLNNKNVINLMDFIDFDHEQLSDLSQYILRLIRENLRTGTKKTAIKSFNDFPPIVQKENIGSILKNINYPFEGHYSDSSYHRVEYIKKHYDGGLLDVVNAYLENVTKQIDFLKKDHELTKSVKGKNVNHNSNNIDKNDVKSKVIFATFEDLFNENKKLRNEENPNITESKGVVLDRHFNIIHIKIKNIEGNPQWDIDENVINTHRYGELRIEVEKNQYENYKKWRDSYKYLQNIQTHLNEYRDFLEKMRKSNTFHYKTSAPKLDLSYTKKNFLGNFHEVSIEDFIEQGEGFGIDYVSLPYNHEEVSDQTNSSFSINTPSHNSIERLLNFLTMQSQITLKQNEMKTIVNGLLLENDEKIIMKKYDEKKRTFEHYKSELLKAKKIDHLSFVQKKIKDNEQERDLELLQNKMHIILKAYAFFVVVILANRPKIIINPLIRCKPYAQKSSNDTDFYLRLFACNIQILSSEPSIFLDFFLPFQDIKSKDEIFRLLQGEFLKLLKKEVYFHAIKKAEQRIIEKNTLPLSKTWDSFLPFIQDLSNTSIELNKHTASSLVIAIQKFIVNVTLTRKLDNANVHSHEPTYCCFERIVNYGNFLPKEINQILHLYQSTYKMGMTFLPKIYIQKKYSSLHDHVFYSKLLTFQKEVDVRTALNWHVNLQNKYLEDLHTFKKSNILFSRDEKLEDLISLKRNDRQGTNSKQKGRNIFGKIPLMTEVVSSLQNISYFMGVIFPRSKTFANNEIYEMWEDMVNTLTRIPNDIDRILYHDFIHRFIRDIMISVQRDKQQYKFNDIHVNKKKFLDPSFRDNIKNIIMNDLIRYEIESSNSDSKRIIEIITHNLQIFNLEHINAYEYKDVNSVYENYILVIYVFSTFMKACLQIIIQQEFTDDILTNMYSLNTLTINEIQKNAIHNLVHHVYSLFMKNKRNTFVSLNTLKDEFENLRERNRRDKQIKEEKIDNDSRFLYEQLKRTNLVDENGNIFNDSEKNDTFNDNFGNADDIFQNPYEKYDINEMILPRDKSEEAYDVNLFNNDED